MSEPKIKGGCFLVSRKLIDSGIMKKPSDYLKVWIYLLSNAFHSDSGDLKRGQGFTSIPILMDMLSYNVGYRIDKPTKKKVYGIIEWLRNPNEGITKVPMIVTTKVTHGFVYTIVNYDLYQDMSNYEGNNEGTTKVLRRSNKGNNINKNDKNDKNEKNNKYNEVFEYYKTNCTLLPQAQKLTEARKSSINARISDYGFDEVLKTLDKANCSIFLTERKDKNGKDKTWLKFDWIFNPNNFVKIYEGNYTKEETKKFVKPKKAGQITL